jgi:hypothetical protein
MPNPIGELRSLLRFALVKLVGPMASRILYALMEQLPHRLPYRRLVHAEP